jgi:hypothetical protein
MRPGHLFHFADFGRIHVEMRDLRVRHKLGNFTGHTIIESCTDGDEEIATSIA